jgi:transcription initiation factor TFIIIB Brf1 subunit/transcription initiation factor TFIIB
MGNTKQKCPECGCAKLKFSEEGLICSKCGLIVSESYFSGKLII